MKLALLIFGSIITLVLLYNFTLMSTSVGIEQYPYTVIKKLNENIEIREYEAALFSSVTMPYDGYRKSSSSGFRVLAGYIFGDNTRNQKIAMTSPVVMEMDSQITMRFMVPAEYTADELPSPNNENITISEKKGGKYAAIRFGGWSSDEKIERYATLLRTALKEENIRFKDRIIFMGYNPPYEVNNRRNEVLFELTPDA